MTTDRGTIAKDKEAQSSVDGRTVRLLCYLDRRSGSLDWDIGAHWKLESGRFGRGKVPRHLKSAIRSDSGELTERFLTTSMRAVLEEGGGRSDDPAGVVVATGGVFYPGTGDPPPSAQVIAISEQLAAFATLVEDYLNTRK
jgi:hypothetical protein